MFQHDHDKTWIVAEFADVKSLRGKKTESVFKKCSH